MCIVNDTQSMIRFSKSILSCEYHWDTPSHDKKFRGKMSTRSTSCLSNSLEGSQCLLFTVSVLRLDSIQQLLMWYVGEYLLWVEFKFMTYLVVTVQFVLSRPSRSTSEDVIFPKPYSDRQRDYQDVWSCNWLKGTVVSLGPVHSRTGSSVHFREVDRSQCNGRKS